MPKVGGKHFSYSSKGKKAAKAYAKKTGQSVGKYQDGGNVDPFSLRNPEGVAVQQARKAVEDKNMANEGIPTTDAMDRSQTSPDTEQYREGGFIKKAVEKYKSHKAGKKREKARKKSVEDFPITSVVQPKTKKKDLKPAKVPSNPPLFKGETLKEKFLNQSILYNLGKKAGKKDSEVKSPSKGKKVSPKGGHSLEPAPITNGRKKKKQWT